MSPSGAVRAGPPAAQANRTADFNAHEYKSIQARVSLVFCPKRLTTMPESGILSMLNAE